MVSVVDEMDRMFRDMARVPWAVLQGQEYEWGPPVDVYEEEGNIVIKARVPGVMKKDVEISATEEGVAIHGTTKEEKEIKEEGYYRHEIRSGSFHRMVPWPDDVDPDSVVAKMENGVLTITAHKTEKPKGGKKVEVA
jgi:HSP20 family protein